MSCGVVSTTDGCSDATCWYATRPNTNAQVTLNSLKAGVGRVPDGRQAVGEHRAAGRQVRRTGEWVRIPTFGSIWAGRRDSSARMGGFAQTAGTVSRESECSHSRAHVREHVRHMSARMGDLRASPRPVIGAAMSPIRTRLSLRLRKTLPSVRLCPGLARCWRRALHPTPCAPSHVRPVWDCGQRCAQNASLPSVRRREAWRAHTGRRGRDEPLCSRAETSWRACRHSIG